MSSLPFPCINPTGRWKLALAVLATSLFAAGCGGGRDVSVSTMSASGLRFNATMTVTVSGAGLTDPDLTMAVDGPCTDVTRLSGSQDNQTQFSCRVSGIGTITPRVVLGNGVVLARVTVEVPQPQVTINTRRDTSVTGSMVVDLDAVAAPETVRNFLTYVSSGLYRNTIFHRVIKDVLIQGGGYTAGPTVVTGLRAPIVLESDNGLKNVRGTIAMARNSLFDSATSQFYLNIADNVDFDFVDAERRGYAVFGRVVSGLEVLDAIGNVPTVARDNSAFANLPVTDVVVTSITQTR